MGHTNRTVNYNLPQFVGTDKPSWLGDVNGAFLAIDSAIAAAKTEADSAAGGVAGLQNTVSSHTTQIGTLTDTVTAQGGTLNTVTALIGNGEPTTTNKTIIGAINELHADELAMKESVSVNYTTSQTWAQIISALAAAYDASKVTSKSVISTGESSTDVLHNVGGGFSNIALGSSGAISKYISITADKFFTASLGDTYTRTDISENNPVANGTITLYY